MTQWPMTALTVLLSMWGSLAGAQSFILVDTTADVVQRNGVCSLREAIIASNENRNVDTLSESCSGTGVNDSIGFRVNGVINVASALPVITEQVTIGGPTARVQLRGPGPGGASFHGLVIQASGTTIRNLVINSFRGSGIAIQSTTGVTVTGSLIGTAADGVTPLGNTIDGITISGPGGPSNHVIGGTGAGQANVIAFNGGNGVTVSGVTGNAIRGNSIHDNALLGIDNINGGNGGIGPPLIIQADLTVSGTFGCASCTLDVYADSANEGATYVGSTTTNGSGVWTFGASPPPGPYVTATVTNSSGNTSEFSGARSCRNFDSDSLCDGVDDSDVDGIADALDNCMLAPNGPAIPDAGDNSQLDIGGDHYGNLCDADLNDSNLVTASDYLILRNVLNTSNNLAADLNGSGLVTSADYVILRNALNEAPGPSGLHRPPCASTPGALGCPWSPGDFVTYPQSFWGTDNTAMTLLSNNYGSVYAGTGGVVEVGIPGAAGFSMLFLSSTAVLNYLPEFGTAAALDSDYFNHTSTSSGIFGAHVLALRLNVDFSDASAMPPGFGDLTLCNLSGNMAGLNGASVRSLLTAAHTLLGGGSGSFSIAAISALTADVNAAFGDGDVSAFAQENLVNGACPS
jgi:CSLREA domain-containing protein